MLEVQGDIESIENCYGNVWVAGKIGAQVTPMIGDSGSIYQKGKLVMRNGVEVGEIEYREAVR